MTVPGVDRKVPELALAPAFVHRIRGGGPCSFFAGAPTGIPGHAVFCCAPVFARLHSAIPLLPSSLSPWALSEFQDFGSPARAVILPSSRGRKEEDPDLRVPARPPATELLLVTCTPPRLCFYAMPRKQNHRTRDAAGGDGVRRCGYQDRMGRRSRNMTVREWQGRWYTHIRQHEFKQ